MSTRQVAAEHMIRQCSDWIEWMESEMVQGGVELPGEDSRLLFVTQALESVDRLSAPNDLEQVLKTELIQGAILRRCWQRQLKLRHEPANTKGGHPALLILKARELVRKINRDLFVVEASDDHQYAVRFPSSERKTRLATELICCEIAAQIGLPVSEMRMILVDRNLVFRAGLLSRYQKNADAGEVACFGLREPSGGLRSLDDARHAWPMASHAARYRAGATIINVMTGNFIPEEPQYRVVSGRAEPVFRDFSHALYDSDWENFVSAKRPESAPIPSCGGRPWKYEHFEPWIRRAEQINLNELCNVILRAPAEWYAKNPFLVTDVIRKLEERRRDLRRTILRLLRAA